MTEIDRSKCQVCAGEVLGGDDQVHYLKSQFDSFHHVQHLRCYLKNERELCASLIEGREDLGEGRLSLAQGIRSLSENQR